MKLYKILICLFLIIPSQSLKLQGPKKRKVQGEASGNGEERAVASYITSHRNLIESLDWLIQNAQSHNNQEAITFYSLLRVEVEIHYLVLLVMRREMILEQRRNRINSAKRNNPKKKIK